jgi:hypothetical protein
MFDIQDELFTFLKRRRKKSEKTINNDLEIIIEVDFQMILENAEILKNLLEETGVSVANTSSKAFKFRSMHSTRWQRCAFVIPVLI